MHYSWLVAHRDIPPARVPRDGDGLDLCRRIRAHSAIPVLMLTARDEESAADFVRTNVLGTQVLLDAARALGAEAIATDRRDRPGEDPERDGLRDTLDPRLKI